MEKIRNLADLLKEKLPTLLSSRHGLIVANAIFNISDAKDRKLIVKSLKDAIKEMFTNKIAHLFIIHIITTLDDT